MFSSVCRVPTKYPLHNIAGHLNKNILTPILLVATTFRSKEKHFSKKEAWRAQFLCPGFIFSSLSDFALNLKKMVSGYTILSTVTHISIQVEQNPSNSMPGVTVMFSCLAHMDGIWRCLPWRWTVPSHKLFFHTGTTEWLDSHCNPSEGVRSRRTKPGSMFWRYISALSTL